MKERIAILGAGPMGLAVAYQLMKEGHHPVVFEADDRVGGMTACFDFNGLEIERYYHFHCTSDEAFLDILKELGLDDKMRWVETKMGYWYRKQLQPWGNPFALLKFKGLSLFAKIRYGMHVFFATRRNDWRALDKKESTAYIKRWVGEEAYDVLWRTLFDYKFYDYAKHLSAAWIWSRIRRIGRSRYNLFKEKLGYLEGGSTTFLQAMQTVLEEKGVEIRLKTPVKRVVIENGKIKGIRTADDECGFEPFDKIISTIPIPYVPQLIPDLPEALLNQYQRIKNIAVVCVIAKLRQSVSENFWMNINDPEMDIPGLVEYSNLRPLEHSIVYVPFYMPGDHPKFAESNQVFIDKVKQYLMKINQSLLEEDFIDVRASRYQHAQPVCEPGFLSLLPPRALPIKGLWVADTSYYYPEDRGISESIAFGRKLAQEVVAC